MGLLFQFPNSEKEVDRVLLDEHTITLKSYGLPLIFWGYLIAFLLLISIMLIAIKNPLMKLFEYAQDDMLNYILALAVLFTFISLPLVAIFIFFYEKRIFKSKNTLKISHCFFGITAISKSVVLKNNNSFYIGHHLDGPNIAKIRNLPETKGFENRGYYELVAELENASLIFVDRHSNKRELENIKSVLEKY